MGRKKKSKPPFIPPPVDQMSSQPQDSLPGNKSGRSKVKPCKGQDATIDGGLQRHVGSKKQQQQQGTVTPAAHQETKAIKECSAAQGVQDSGNASTEHLDSNVAAAGRDEECLFHPLDSSFSGTKSRRSKAKPNKEQNTSTDGNGKSFQERSEMPPREKSAHHQTAILSVEDSETRSKEQTSLDLYTTNETREKGSGPPADSVRGNKPLKYDGHKGQVKSAVGGEQEHPVGSAIRQECKKTTHETEQETETNQYTAVVGDKESGNHSTGITVNQYMLGSNVQIGDGNTFVDRREYHSAGADADESAGELSSDVERIGAVAGIGQKYEHSSLSESSHTEMPAEWGTAKCKKKKKKRQKTYAAALGAQTTEQRAQSNTTQNIKADKVVTNINITQRVHETTPKSSEIKTRSSTFREFLEAVADFKKGHYILVTHKMEQLRNLDALSLVPWTAVFDLDPDTRSLGLLSNVEETLQKRRALHVLSWNEPCSVTERSTNWVSVRGFSERPDTLTSDNHKQWKKEIRDHLDSQLKQLKEFQDGYTRFRVIVLWPDDNSIIHHMNYLLTEIEEALNPSFIVIDEGNEKTDIARSVLTTIEDAFGEKLKTIPIMLGDVCKAIASKLSKPINEGSAEYLLPTSDKTNIPDICAEKAQFLGEDLEVLYINNDTGQKLSQKEIHEQQDLFFKGGSLPWAWWYEIGPGQVDIERDILHEMTAYIKREHIEFCKSGRITLYHAPGSGGTTLAQRLLWELRREVPCAQVKHRTGTVATDVISKVQFLSDKTHLPIILLLDGEEEQKVDHIERLGGNICMLVIYVKRSTEEPTLFEGEFWLKHGISQKEGKRLSIKYIQQCQTEHQKTAVNILLDDIHKGIQHSLVEFGLAMHSYKYRGIEGFVEGFLKLKENTDKTLMPWQQALAFLSLVLYYGQITIPCQLFSELLGKDDKDIFQFEDFPEGMKGLIVTDPHEGKANVVRICHYYVAKEILDQILPWPNVGKKNVSPKICSVTKQKLEPFVIDLITLAAQQSSNNASYNINKIMTRTFISRDNQPCGEKDTVPKKPKLSSVLEDVGDRPPYTERFTVLEHLTNSFPTNAQFRAHLGRLYTLCRPEEDEKAEKCFKEALQICHKHVAGKTIEEIPHSMKLTLTHIYHMYGVMFSTKVSTYTGRHLGDIPVRKLEDTEFIDTATMLLSWVKTACKNFSNCRTVTPPGCEESFLFSGEIQVKLMLCDFINAKSGCRSLLQFKSDVNPDLSKFIQDCFVELQDLFLELFSVINPEKIDKDVWKNQNWYAALFKTSRPGHCRLQTDDQISSERMDIAVTKMQYSNQNTYGTLELVTNTTDVRKIVEGYERIFQEADALNYKNTHKRTMDHDHREWLFAIRLENCPKHCVYPVDRVLKRVQTWYDGLHTPYSIFYLFVLKSILGFGRGGIPGYTQLLVEAQELKEEMLKRCKYIPKPRFPREWLGDSTEESIRRLVPGRRFIGQIKNGKEAQQRMALVENKCETMTGTILRPNDRPAGGYIDLDLGRQNRVPVKVFYVPVVAEMKGVSYVGSRVEFIIGFSMSHGYEAFNVQQIGHLHCDKCEKSAEIKSTDKYAKCLQCKSKIRRAARPKRQ